jgi:CTD kinase subunit alpha
MDRRLQTLEGDWHEFESKALRKENERKDKEARRASKKEALEKDKDKEKDKKRGPDNEPTEHDAKRLQLDASTAGEKHEVKDIEMKDDA